MQTSWLLVAAAALAATGSSVNTVFAASTSQCSSVTTCYEGGASSTPCTVSTGGCPPCITFADDGCYVKVSGSCPFGVDCSSVWGSSSTTTSSGSTTSSTSTSSTTGTTSSGSTTSGTSTTTSSTTSDSDTTGTAGTSSNSSTGTAGTSSGSSISSASGSSGTSAGDSTSSGSDMSVVFAIIGAAIGVIAVAVIFLTLVRRSKAAHEDEDDDDDMANTPPAFAKNPVVQAPHSTPGATTYASYAGMNRPAGMGSGTAGEIGLDMSKSGGVSMNAVSYYNQQPPHNSAAPSPRVAGRAIPSQPVGMNQPMGMGRQFGSNPNFAASGGVGVTSGLGASGVGMTSQAPPAVVQHIPMGGVAPSPHSRRESYEF